MKPTTVDLFGGTFQKRKEVTPKTPEIFPMAETLLSEFITSQENLIEELDYYMDFDDTDAISDCLNNYSEKLVRHTNEVKYHKENPYDILHNFKRKYRAKTKFRRYANNKRTAERLG